MGENVVLWIILLVAGVVVSYITGKRAELRAFCKELGEGFLALDEFLGKEDPSKEDAAKLKKEWLDVIQAAGKLFKNVMKKTMSIKYKKMGKK